MEYLWSEDNDYILKPLMRLRLSLFIMISAFTLARPGTILLSKGRTVPELILCYQDFELYLFELKDGEITFLLVTKFGNHKGQKRNDYRDGNGMLLSRWTIGFRLRSDVDKGVGTNARMGMVWLVKGQRGKEEGEEQFNARGESSPALAPQDGGSTPVRISDDEYEVLSTRWRSLDAERSMLPFYEPEQQACSATQSKPDIGWPDHADAVAVLPEGFSVGVEYLVDQGDQANGRRKYAQYSNLAQSDPDRTYFLLSRIGRRAVIRSEHVRSAPVQQGHAGRNSAGFGIAASAPSPGPQSPAWPSARIQTPPAHARIYGGRREIEWVDFFASLRYTNNDPTAHSTLLG
ncbi:hypothetical protein Dda_6972 [Drechslerella dactyloides]|uniref:Uncharacterized protein n=1 Tax=Drechslerella dactyloides TaxID=74499 RepID=A0AAD6IUX6_DREDA|nr:hypothetical protein Dda_6972 [Drechslerella dactyloides]